MSSYENTLTSVALVSLPGLQVENNFTLKAHLGFD